MPPKKITIERDEYDALTDPDKCLVNRAEHAALCDLRDGAHHRVQMQVKKLQAELDAVHSINLKQVARINQVELEDVYLRKQVVELTHQAQRAEARAAELEPLRSKVAQPLFTAGSRS